MNKFSSIFGKILQIFSKEGVIRGRDGDWRGKEGKGIKVRKNYTKLSN